MRATYEGLFSVHIWEGLYEVLLVGSAEGVTASMLNKGFITSDAQPTLEKAMAQLRTRYNAVAQRMGWEQVPPPKEK